MNEKIHTRKIKDLVSEGDVNSAMGEWQSNWEAKYGNLPGGNFITAVKRLTYELFIQRLSDKPLTYMLEFEGTEEYKLCKEITAGLNGKESAKALRSARAIYRRLIDPILNQQKISRDASLRTRAVHGDPELTDPNKGVAGVGGRSSFIWENEANPRGLGYVQSKPKED